MSPAARFSTFALVVGICATMFLAAPRSTSTPTLPPPGGPHTADASVSAPEPVAKATATSAVPEAPAPIPSAPAPLGKPNIVVLLIDDFAAMDDRVFERLPNFKSTFLDQGISFTNYWGNFSLCCPGRAALLSGQRDDHNGVMQNKATLFDPRETIATEL